MVQQRFFSEKLAHIFQHFKEINNWIELTTRDKIKNFFNREFLFISFLFMSAWILAHAKFRSLFFSSERLQRASSTFWRLDLFRADQCNLFQSRLETSIWQKQNKKENILPGQRPEEGCHDVLEKKTWLCWDSISSKYNDKAPLQGRQNCYGCTSSKCEKQQAIPWSSVW